MKSTPRVNVCSNSQDSCNFGAHTSDLELTNRTGQPSSMIFPSSADSSSLLTSIDFACLTILVLDCTSSTPVAYSGSCERCSKDQSPRKCEDFSSKTKVSFKFKAYWATATELIVTGIYFPLQNRSNLPNVVMLRLNSSNDAVDSSLLMGPTFHRHGTLSGYDMPIVTIFVLAHASASYPMDSVLSNKSHCDHHFIIKLFGFLKTGAGLHDIVFPCPHILNFFIIVVANGASLRSNSAVLVNGDSINLHPLIDLLPIHWHHRLCTSLGQELKPIPCQCPVCVHTDSRELLNAPTRDGVLRNETSMAVPPSSDDLLNAADAGAQTHLAIASVWFTHKSELLSTCELLSKPGLPCSGRCTVTVAPTTHDSFGPAPACCSTPSAVDAIFELRQLISASANLTSYIMDRDSSARCPSFNNAPFYRHRAKHRWDTGPSVLAEPRGYSKPRAWAPAGPSLSHSINTKFLRTSGNGTGAGAHQRVLQGMGNMAVLAVRNSAATTTPIGADPAFWSGVTTSATTAGVVSASCLSSAAHTALFEDAFADARAVANIVNDTPEQRQARAHGELTVPVVITTVLSAVSGVQQHLPSEHVLGTRIVKAAPDIPFPAATGVSPVAADSGMVVLIECLSDLSGWISAHPDVLRCIGASIFWTRNDEKLVAVTANMLPLCWIELCMLCSVLVLAQLRVYEAVASILIVCIGSLSGAHIALKLLYSTSPARSSEASVPLASGVPTFRLPTLFVVSVNLLSLTASTYGAFADVDMAGFTSGSTGFRMIGGATSDRYGRSATGVGDVNGDGIDDVAIGSEYADPLGRDAAGTVTVIYGHSTATSFSEVDPTTFSFGAGGFQIYGAAAGDKAGYVVACAGDVNGDGISDILIGAPNASPGGMTNAGAAYVVFGRLPSDPFPAVLDLLGFVSGATGFKVIGAAAGDYIGYSARGAGDVNGDGFADVIIGTPEVDAFSRQNIGAAYILFGHSSGTAFTDIFAGTFTSGTVGYRVYGAVAADGLGYSVGAAGDVNGDGYDDTVLGAYLADPTSRSNAGIAYVIFGHSTGTAFTDIDLLSFTSGATGFRILGAQATSQGGWSVGGAGDVNNDGYDDVVVGANMIDYAGRADAGAAYVIFGRRGVPAFTDVDLLTMTYGTLGFRIYGSAGNENLGSAVNGGGDLNHDGINDLLIGAYYSDANGRVDSGTAVVIFGHSNKTTFPDIDVLSPLGELGYRLFGAAAGDAFVTVVSAAGDVNNDGTDDFIVGSILVDVGARTDTGAAYVIFGVSVTPSMQPSTKPTVQLTMTPTVNPAYADKDMAVFSSGASGFRTVGSASDDSCGRSATGIGDVNGDGIDDVAIGCPDADPLGRANAGTVMVIYGHSIATPYTEVDPLAFSFGSGGFQIYGAAAGDAAGYAVAGAEDVNGDGVGDIIVGAYDTDLGGFTDAGVAYVIFGRAQNNPFPSILDLTSFASGASGFKVLGFATDYRLGYSVSSAGDVNGDGFADVLLGSHYADPSSRNDAGAAYLFFGHSATTAAFTDIAAGTFTTGAVGYKIYGAAPNDYAGYIVARAGDVNGDGYDDVIIGAPGADNQGRANAGTSYVIFGHSGAFTDIDLLSFTSGATGFRILGAQPQAQSGNSVCTAGDVNDDGYDDVIVGAYAAPIEDQTDAGAAYVIFGRRGIPAFTDVDLLTMTYGTLGFRIYSGMTGDQWGSAVSGAGDVNADGFHDILIGAYGANALNRGDSGAAVVVFGHSNQSSFVDIDVRNSLGVLGYRLYGGATDDAFGTSAHAAGDVNDDGVDDFIIGGYRTDYGARTNSGAAYVIFGTSVNPTARPTIVPTIRPSITPTLVPSLNPAYSDKDMATFTSGSTGFRVVGSASDDTLGISVSGLGDINGDGIDDVAIGSILADPLGRIDAGIVYVLYGHTAAAEFTEVDPLTFNFGTGGFQIYGAEAGDRTGIVVAGAGDVNGDGIRDIVIATFGTTTATPPAYVLFGRASSNSFPAIVDLASSYEAPIITSSYPSLLTSSAPLETSRRLANAPVTLKPAVPDTTAGFKVTGALASRRVAASGAGDVNGDGYDDVIFGASYEQPLSRTYAGTTFVLFGHSAASAFTDIDLSTFTTGTTGFKIFGPADEEFTGISVAGLGDANGDGFDDIIIGSQYADPLGRTTAGVAYVIFGHSGAFTDIDLASFTSGATGFRILGAAASDALGDPVGGAGDINNDGYDDIAVGAIQADYLGRTDAGVAYVIFGRLGVPAFADVDLLTMVSGTLGFRIYGAIAVDYLGVSICSAGDVNADGITDLLVGAFAADALDRVNSGAMVVIFGHSNQTAFTDIDVLSSLGELGYRIYGAAAGDRLGHSVTSAGDINSDGVDDFIMGAYNVDYQTRIDTGAAYVIFGTSVNPTTPPTLVPTIRPSVTPTLEPSVNPAYADKDMAEFASGSGGFRVVGSASDDESGASVDGIGDINGDGIDDVAISSALADPLGRIEAGIVIVMYGHSTATAFTEVDPNTFNFGSDGFRIYGAVAGDRAGVLVAGAGDINDDGVHDIIVGTFGSTATASAYVIFGRGSDSPFPAYVDLATFVSGTTGFKVSGAVMTRRIAASGAGDVNGDGYDDIVIGAEYERSYAGTTCILFGHSTASAFADIDISTFTTGTIGFKIFGAAADDFTGVSVDCAGDVNGDGFDDVIIGAHYGDPLGRTDAGLAYVMFGHSGAFTDINLSTFASGVAGYRILGAAAFDKLGEPVSGAGDINNDGYDDIAMGVYQADNLGRADAGTAYVIFGRRGVPSADVDLLTMTYGTLGFRVYGAVAGDFLGVSVSSAGDVNADGIADLVVGAFIADVIGRTDGGAAIIVFGHSNRTSFQDIDVLSSLGELGYRIYGAVDGDRFGTSVSAAGDVNDDGVDDFIVGAYYVDYQTRTDAGAAYVIFGASIAPTAVPTHAPTASPTRPPTVSPSVNAAHADKDMAAFASGANGFRVVGGSSGDDFGRGVSGIGDVNGDGIDDVAIGGPDADPLGRTAAGTVMIIYGHTTATTFTEVDPTTFSFGSSGFCIYGAVAGDATGFSVAGAGDVNGDGIADIIVGVHAFDADYTDGGAAYVIFGRPTSSPFPAVVDLLSYITGTTGFRLTGNGVTDILGQSVSGAGDINGDGYSDVIVGAQFADPLSRTDAGAAYVLFGHSTATSFSNLAAGTFTTGTIGFRIHGAVAGDRAGMSVCGAGDYNGDSYDDIIVGAVSADPQSQSNTGIAYVIFGHSTGTAFTDIDLLSFTSGTTGFRILGAQVDSEVGSSVAGAGDMNGDGYGDIVVGAWQYDYSGRSEAGVAYVIFGRRGVSTADVDLLTMTYGTLGFRIYGAVASDQLGVSAKAAGDVNDDGVADLIVGAYGADVLGRTNSGSAVIVFGHSNRTSFPDIDIFSSLGELGYRIFGGAADDWFGTSVQAAGDVNDDGTADFIVGGHNVDYQTRTDTGAGYVIFGTSVVPTTQPSVVPTKQPSAAPTTASPTRTPTINAAYTDKDMASFAFGTQGFRVFGSAISDVYGRTDGLGDINGDGIDDIIVAGHFADPLGRTNAGAAMVVYGHSTATAFADVDPLTYNFGSGGFQIYGAAATDITGYSVAGVGDVNGDGIGDIAIGAPQADPNSASNAGVVYVLFGRPASGPFPAFIDLASYITSTTGFKVTGGAANDNLGWSVRRAGDVNGDGFADVIIGAPQADPFSRAAAGAAYVIFGHSMSTTFTTIAASSFTTGTIGFKIFGAVAGDVAGTSGWSAGDVNGDGYNDFIVGAQDADPLSRSNAGISYVIFGHSTATAFTDIDLSTFTSGATGFRILGAQAGGQLGSSASEAGDVNNDGYDDVIVGARSADYLTRTDSGIAYVIFGRRGVPAFADIDLLTMTYGTLGFRLYGAVAGDSFGAAVSSAGDVNGDGTADLLVDAFLADSLGRTDSGGAVVIFGHNNKTTFPDIDVLNSLGELGYRIYGGASNDQLGCVRAVGDVNDDGTDDFAVGAPLADVGARTDAGISYIIFGTSVTPTKQPASPPTQPPYVAPTGQPSRQPTSRPFSMPSTHPYADPTAEPVALPSSQPSTQPSMRPASQPSSRPSGQPHSHPSAVPTGKPSLQPLSLPSSQPSSHPTGQPTDHPSVQPTGKPSTHPSSQPTSNPSVQPTGQPSVHPSGQPTEQPSVYPTGHPSIQPSRQPSGYPSMQPTRQPSSQPTRQPSTHPSSQPSNKPSVQPSRQPSSQPSMQPRSHPSAQPSTEPSRPTANPTISTCPPGTRYESLETPEVCIDCPAGRYSNTVGGAATCTKCGLGEYAENSRSSSCEKCPQGSYADVEETATCSSCRAGTYHDVTGADSADACRLCSAGTTSTERASGCSACEQGSYAAEDGSPICGLCAAGTYAEGTGAIQCTDCAAGYYTDVEGTTACFTCPPSTYSSVEGIASAADCIPCPPNRISGKGSTRLKQCLNPAANFVQGSLALLIAFVVSIVYILLGRMNAVAYGRMRYIQKAGESYIALVKAMQCVVERKVEETRTSASRVILFWTFVGLAVLLFIVVVALLTFTTMLKIFFSAMIMFRNVSVTLPDLNFTKRMESVMEHLSALVGFNVFFLFGWAFVAFDALASLSFSFDFANVTCIGSQAPITLLVNILLFVVIVILIECEVAAFLVSTFYKAHYDYQKMVLNERARDTVDYPDKERYKMWLRSVAECALFSANSVTSALQFAMSLLSVVEFFKYYGRHRSEPSCDKVNGVAGIDTALAISSSVLTYALLPAVLYNIAKLLAPRLALREKYNSGKQGFTHEHTINFIDKHPVTLFYSPVPAPDAFLSWRFRWAYDVLQMHKYTKPDELMFKLPDGMKVDRPIGIGLCPLVSTSTTEFQDDWKAECQQRLPEYGLFLSRSFILYARVLWLNVWTFMCVVVGYWNPDSVDKFDLIDAIRVSGVDTPQEVRIVRSISAVSVMLSFCKLLYRTVTCGGTAYSEGKYSVPEDGGESRNLVSRMIFAKLSTRATLCLLFPFGGLITTFVSYTAAYPLFCCQDKSLNRSLPGLIVFDSYLLAEKRVRRMGSYAKWKVQFMSWYIFVTESRLLNFWNGVKDWSTVVLAVLFEPPQFVQAIFFLLIVAYSMARALYAVVLLGNLMGIHDDDQHEVSVHPERDTEHPADNEIDDDPEFRIGTQLSALSTRREYGESSRSMPVTPMQRMNIDRSTDVEADEEAPLYTKDRYPFELPSQRSMSVGYRAADSDDDTTIDGVHGRSSANSDDDSASSRSNDRDIIVRSAKHAGAYHGLETGAVEVEITADVEAAVGVHAEREPPNASIQREDHPTKVQTGPSKGPHEGTVAVAATTATAAAPVEVETTSSVGEQALVTNSIDYAQIYNHEEDFDMHDI